MIELSILIVSLITSGTWFFAVFSITQTHPIITSISGDGTKIAFASDVDGDYEVFVVNSDGTGLTQLAPCNPNSYPSISGDGTKIAFHSWMPPSGMDIAVINSDGIGATRLTRSGAYDLYVSISGDGKKMAFHSTLDGDNEIFVINSDGTGLTQLTDNTATDQYASISDDGTKIAYTSNVNGDYEVFVVSLESNSDHRSITRPETGYSFPIEYVAAGIVAVIVAVALVVIFFVRKK